MSTTTTVLEHVFVYWNMDWIRFLDVFDVMFLDLNFDWFGHVHWHQLFNGDWYSLLNFLGHQFVDGNGDRLGYGHLNTVGLRHSNFDHLRMGYSNWMWYGHVDFLDNWHWVVFLFDDFLGRDMLVFYLDLGLLVETFMGTVLTVDA